MKVYCGAATNIPVLYLFSSLDFVSVCKAVNCCHGSHLALVCLAVVSVISAKIENVKHAASSFIFALCDVLGTPSVPPFCHNNVWLWACVTSVCQGYKPAIPRFLFPGFPWLFPALRTWLETEEHGLRGLELLATEALDLCDLEARERSGWHTMIRPLIPCSRSDRRESARGVLSSVTNWVKHAPGSRTEQ